MNYGTARALRPLADEGPLKRADPTPLRQPRCQMDDVASMAVAALEHPKASVTAAGEAGSNPGGLSRAAKAARADPADAHYRGRIAVIETKSREPQFCD